MKLKVDDSLIEKKMAAAEQKVVGLSREAAVTSAFMFGQYIIPIAPRRTNRYVNGWIHAVNDIIRRSGASIPGVRTIEPFPLRQESGDRIRDILETQLERLYKDREYKQSLVERDEKRMARRKKKRAYWKSTKQTKKDLRKIEKAIARAEETLAKFSDADAAGAAVILIHGRKTKRKYSLSSLASIREKVYGGEGRIIETASGFVVQVKNKEPHARIVERHTRAGRRVRAILKATGLKTVSRKALNELTEHTRRAA